MYGTEPLIEILYDKSLLVVGSLLLAGILPTHALLAPRTLPQNAPQVLSLSLSSQSRSIPGNMTSKAYHNNSSYLDAASIATDLRSLTVNNSLVPQHHTSSRLFTDGYFHVSCGARSTTSSGYAFPDFSRYCVLWDDSCPGNRSWVLRGVGYKNLAELGDQVCFGNPFCQCMVDEVPAPAASISSYAELLNFMRSPQCLSAFPDDEFCCQDEVRGCYFSPTFVDVYYWPDADADTSCLSIIGDSIHPWDHGATTTTFTEDLLRWNRTQTYWGCNVTDMVRTTNIHDALFIISGVLTTAAMTSVLDFTFKESYFNPWEGDQPCPETFSGFTPSASNASLPSGVKIRPRALDPKNSIKSRNDSSFSVVTLNGQTFTSPSIYVNFQMLKAVDACGPIGSTDSISTMMAFDPGELSTMVGGGYNAQKLSVFNVADLPCPPQSVMEANRYKPGPGEPYIPRLAFHTKLKALDLLWTTCEDKFFFTAFDPPRTLVPVSAVSPEITADPYSSSGNARKGGSTVAAVQTPAPVSRHELQQPKQTAAPSLNPGFVNGDPGLPNLFPIHNSVSRDELDHDGGAAWTAHIANSEASVQKPGNDPGSDLPKMPMDPFNDMGIPSVSNANTLDLDNDNPKITNIAGNEATFLPDAIAIGGSSLEKGSSPITVSGTIVSLASTAMVIGSKTLPLPRTHKLVTTIAGSPLIYHPYAVAISGKTLTPGSGPKTLSNAVVAIDSSGLIIAPKPLALPQTERIVTAVAGHEMTLLPHAIVLDGTTLTPGGSPFTLADMAMTFGPSSLLIRSQVLPFNHLDHMTISPSQKYVAISNHRAAGVKIHRHSISINSDGNLVIGGSTLRPGGAGMAANEASISVAPNHHLVLAGTMLLPGGNDVTIDGTPVSVANNGDLVVNGATLHAGSSGVPFGSTPISVASNGDLLIDGNTFGLGGHGTLIDGTPVYIASGGEVVLDGTTLTPGGADMTFDGTPINVASDGDLVVDGITLAPGGQGASLSGLSVSVASNGNLVLSGTTLTPSGIVVTVDGRLISITSDGNMVVGGTTSGSGSVSGSAGLMDDATTTPKASNTGLGSTSMGASEDRPTVASPTSRMTTAVALEGKAVGFRVKFSSLAIIMLSMLIRI